MLLALNESSQLVERERNLTGDISGFIAVGCYRTLLHITTRIKNQGNYTVHHSFQTQLYNTDYEMLLALDESSPPVKGKGFSQETIDSMPVERVSAQWLEARGVLDQV